MSEEKKSGTHVETIHLPAPTAWPIVMAFGVTMGFLGLVTILGITVLGVVLALTISNMSAAGAMMTSACSACASMSRSILEEPDSTHA